MTQESNKFGLPNPNYKGLGELNNPVGSHVNICLVFNVTCIENFSSCSSMGRNYVLRIKNCNARKFYYEREAVLQQSPLFLASTCLKSLARNKRTCCLLYIPQHQISARIKVSLAPRYYDSGKCCVQVIHVNILQKDSR